MTCHNTRQDRSMLSAERRAYLVQWVTIKANCHVANNTPAPPRTQNATRPLVLSDILCLVSRLGSRHRRGESPFRAPAPRDKLLPNPFLLVNIGNNMGNLSARVS